MGGLNSAGDFCLALDEERKRRIADSFAGSTRQTGASFDSGAGKKKNVRKGGEERKLSIRKGTFVLIQPFEAPVEAEHRKMASTVGDASQQDARGKRGGVTGEVLRHLRDYEGTRGRKNN